MIKVPEKAMRVDYTITDLADLNEIQERRLYLYGAIMSVGVYESDDFTPVMSATSALVKQIIAYNREDHGIDPKERKPIVLFINSPGGELIEGFPLISAIELSKTPVYTVNVGEWCSMAFQIGITGHKRFSLPYMTFLMHEASGAMVGKISDMEAKLDFDRKFNDRVTREHILRHSKMSGAEYDLVAKKEFYMLAEEAMQYGFIDEIIKDIDVLMPNPATTI